MIFEYLINKEEAKEVFDALVVSGFVSLYAYYHQKYTFGAKPQIIRLPMNTERDYRVAASIFEHRTQVYADNMQTGWVFIPEDLDEASPTIALEKR